MRDTNASDVADAVWPTPGALCCRAMAVLQILSGYREQLLAGDDDGLDKADFFVSLMRESITDPAGGALGVQMEGAWDPTAAAGPPAAAADALPQAPPRGSFTSAENEEYFNTLLEAGLPMMHVRGHLAPHAWPDSQWYKGVTAWSLHATVLARDCVGVCAARAARGPARTQGAACSHAAAVNASMPKPQTPPVAACTVSATALVTSQCRSLCASHRRTAPSRRKLTWLLT